MREQYHYRLIDARLIKWDVQRLVELAKALPVKTVIETLPYDEP